MSKYSKDPRVWAASIGLIVVVLGGMGVNFKFASAESLENVRLELKAQKRLYGMQGQKILTLSTQVHEILTQQKVNYATNKGKFENISSEFKRAEGRDKRSEATQQRILDLLTNRVSLKRSRR